MTRSLSPVSLLFVCLVAAPLVAQSAPPPPTPYPTPLTGYTGRYLDSSATQSSQIPPRTFRTGAVKAAPEYDALFMIVGSTLVGQTLSTFVDRVGTEPLLTSQHGERYLAFEKWMDPERSAGWSTFGGDFQVTMFDFDWDDRGYLYVATLFGVGIIRESDFGLVRQFQVSTAPRVVLSFRIGSTYYLYVSGSGSASLFDVTNAAAPVSLAVIPPAIRDAAKTTSGLIARVESSRSLTIHTAETLVANSAPLFTVPGTDFREVATDGSNFYAVDGAGTYVIRPSGASFTVTVTPRHSGFPPIWVEYGAGYLVVGRHFPAIYRVDGDTLTLLHDGSYFNDYATALQPTNPYANLGTARFLPVAVNGQTHLLAGMHGLGDVYAMTAQPPLTLAKQFSPASMQPGQPSQLTVTITNPNPTPVAFGLTDTYPTNVVNTASAPATTCGGTLTATAGEGLFQLWGGVVPASGTCSITVSVTSTVPGTYANTIPANAIVSDDNTNTAPASATLTVARLAAPQVQKAFSVSTAEAGTPVRLTITITNPNASPITGLTFNDVYPSNLLNATPVNAANTCGGSLTALAGGASLALSGGTVGPSGSCTVAVDVVGVRTGTISNVIAAGSVTSANAEPSSGAATAVLNATPAQVPTASEWALIAMAILLAMAASLRMRA